MCGIVGIFGDTGDKEGALAGMLKAVRSRGETDEILLGEGFCVATRRLKIVDRERAIQPIFNETRDKFIIFSILIVMNTLDERRGTITNTDYRYVNLTQNSLPFFLLVRFANAH